MPSERGDSSVLTEALPDLIIGLVGIPVAFALQSIAGPLAERSQLVSEEALRLVAFLVSLYADYSAIVYLTFQASMRDPVLRLQWQTHFIWLVIPHALLAMVFVGGVIGFGKAYESCQFDAQFLTARICVLALVGALLPLIYYPRILNFLWDRYQVLMKLLFASSVIPISFLMSEVIQEFLKHS
jgi:hypothetical protein